MAQRVLEVCGEAPYVVIAQYHRRYLDANRSRDCAFEHPDAAPFYDEYHATVRAFADEIRTENGGLGLLFDIHGTAGIAGDPAVIFLGTANGETVARLLAADPQALWRRRSLRGYLEAAGHGVSPSAAGHTGSSRAQRRLHRAELRQRARRRPRCDATGADEAVAQRSRTAHSR